MPQLTFERVEKKYLLTPAQLDALALSAGDRGSPLSVQGLYLMEVKLPGVMPLWLAHGLAQVGAAPVSFSKYGCCYRKFLQEDVRHAG